MTLTLEHHDSPYIRCMGFLYLRYSCEPQYVWNWIRPYLYDQELVTVQNHGQEGTIGDFVRSLFGDLDYYGTRLPRLPVNIERDLKVKLLQAERNEERAKKHINTKGRIEYFKKLGSSVRALYEDDDNPLTWYDAVVDRVLTTDPDSGVAFVRPKFVVTFPEYGNTETVTLGEIDIPGGSDDGLTGFDNRGNPSRMERGHGRHRGDDRGHGTGGGGGGRQYDDRRQGYGREQALMEEVLRRERAEASTSNRRNYGTRPSTTKEMFSHARDDRKRSSNLDRRSPPPPKRKRSPPPQQQQHQQFERSRPYQKTPEELAAIAEKKRKLMAKYG
eukprot:CAMPEP_0202458584 /NCGR_PEP_ID=MMETSP1360-20130828/26465_1 /ASSEMBLY_ACC=CAM_ASM_000848 /TAXON_ID=515479 /ORGANISM="Licmophora paradoxa, Strain CCMP2313" /LENGTH=329 /DNA_ID=CAMNT_0049079193 /DNA_START=580 /DNA_END=1569 /DNA_ORIENTATION=-